MSSNIRIQRICLFCKKEFVAKTTVTKTCSDACAKKLYKLKKKEEKIQASNEETISIRNKPVIEIQGKEYLNIGEASALLGVSRRTIYRMIEVKRFKIGKVGNRTVIKRSEIEKIFL